MVITGARGAGRNDKMSCRMAELRTRYVSDPDAAQLAAQSRVRARHSDGRDGRTAGAATSELRRLACEHIAHGEVETCNGEEHDMQESERVSE